MNTDPLPKLGDYIPLLDDGRIEVAGPEGWSVPGRSSKWIVRFQKSASSPYPTIMLTAEDCRSPSNVSESNVNEFASEVASERSVAPVKPIQIGHFVGVTYRRRAVEKDSINRILERLFLETVVAGRRYVVELRAREGSLGEAQPYLLAVAAGIRFLDVEAEPGPTEPQPAPERIETEESRVKSRESQG